MRVIRKPAYQGHAVPQTASAPRGPFSPEVLAPSVIVFDDTDPDLLYPLGATAQNDYQAPQYFRCRLCGEVMAEDEMDAHYCEETDGQG